MGTSECCFIPRWFLRYLAVFSIFHFGASSYEKGTRGRVSAQDTCQIIGAVCYSTLLVIMLADYWTFYLQDLITLDFFVIVSFINRSNYSCQAPFMFFIFFVQRQKIRKLLRDISTVISGTFSRQEQRLWLLKSTFLTAAWLILCHVAHLIVIYFFAVHILTGGKSGHNTLLLFGNDQRFAVPKWIFSCLAVPSFVLTLNTDLAVQLFCFNIIAAMSQVLVKVNHVLDVTYLKETKISASTETVVWAVTLTFRMRHLHRRLNQTFGYVIFLNCVRDLTAMVALMSMLLRTDEPRRPGENPEDYESRVQNRELKEQVHLCESVISVGNAVLRSIICVYSQQQTARLLHRFEDISISPVPPVVKKACKDAIVETDFSSSAISAAGFFYITKEYIAGVVGVFLTYAILIYQARDSKTSSEDYAKLADLKNSTSVILAAIVQNQKLPTRS